MNGLLPIVDLAAKDAAAAIDRACRETGFFYVVGHGVPPALQHGAVLLGQRRPDEHRPARLLDRPAELGEAVAEDVATRLVDLAHLLREVLRLVERDGRGDLDRLERAVVEVALELGQGLHHLAVADHGAREIADIHSSW